MILHTNKRLGFSFILKKPISQIYVEKRLCFLFEILINRTVLHMKDM